MKAILIDANVYLGLYETVEMSKLLPSLSKAAGSIFVTERIVREVARRRLDVVERRMSAVLSVQPPKVGAIPEVAASKEEKVEGPFEALRIASEAVRTALENAQKRANEVLKDVATGKDRITRELQPIFATAKTATEAQVKRARSRHEVGDPPGKYRDPLGDQMTWEQFLDQLKPPGPIWIVTKDSDFGATVNAQLLLNPILYDELSAKGVTDVRVTSDLLPALKDFQATTSKSLPLPPKAEEPAIAAAERDATLSAQVHAARSARTITDAELAHTLRASQILAESVAKNAGPISALEKMRFDALSPLAETIRASQALAAANQPILALEKEMRNAAVLALSPISMGAEQAAAIAQIREINRFAELERVSRLSDMLAGTEALSALASSDRKKR